MSKLKNQAIANKTSFQVVLQLFAQEEFLRRLSSSPYSNNFVLKGGMFIYEITKFQARPTQDIDFLIINLQGHLDYVKDVMTSICEANSINDFLELKIIKMERITLEKKYPGIRTRIIGRIKNIRIPFSVDIGIDDIVFPRPEKRKLSTRLPEFESPEIFTYSLESTIAEKIDAILERMTGTSRMKDFYDIFYLSSVFNFDGVILSEAINKTLLHRKRKIDPAKFDEMKEFVNNEFLTKRWKAYEPSKIAGLDLDEAVNRIVTFLKPVFQGIVKSHYLDRTWSCSDKKWIDKKTGG